MTESEPGENHRVQSLLARLGELSDGDGGVRFDVLLETSQARGFGPLLLTISAFLLLPVGMVPGVPALVGATLVILGVQLCAAGVACACRIRWDGARSRNPPCRAR